MAWFGRPAEVETAPASSFLAPTAGCYPSYAKDMTRFYSYAPLKAFHPVLILPTTSFALGPNWPIRALSICGMARQVPNSFNSWRYQTPNRFEGPPEGPGTKPTTLLENRFQSQLNSTGINTSAMIIHCSYKDPRRICYILDFFDALRSVPIQFSLPPFAIDRLAQ